MSKLVVLNTDFRDVAGSSKTLICGLWFQVLCAGVVRFKNKEQRRAQGGFRIITTLNQWKPPVVNAVRIEIRWIIFCAFRVAILRLSMNYFEVPIGHF